jgi:hypothetical protein
MKLEFSRQILNRVQGSSLVEIRLVGVGFYANRQTDIVAFRNFADAPKNAMFCSF